MDERGREPGTKKTNFRDAPPFPWEEDPDNREIISPDNDTIGDIKPFFETAESDPAAVSGPSIFGSYKSSNIMENLKSFWEKLTKRRDLLQEMEKTETSAKTEIDFFEQQYEIAEAPDPFSEIVNVPEDSSKEQFSEIDERFTIMEKELGELKNRVFLEEHREKTGTEGIESRINETVENISSLKNKIDLLETNLSSLDESRETLMESFDEVSGQIQEIVRFQASMGEEIKAAVEESISKYESAAEKNAMMLETEIGDIKESQEEIKDNISSLSEVLAGLMEDIAHLGQQSKKNAAEIQKQEENINNEINSLKSFIDEEVKKVGSHGYYAGENVQLTKIVKNSTNTKLCMEWLEFLMELVGRNNLPDILAYYEELGWINDHVRLELMRYAEGIDFYVEKPDWKLSPDDHVKSIWFIEKLAGLKVDKNQLSIVERDIKKVKGGTEIYGI